MPDVFVKGVYSLRWTTFITGTVLEGQEKSSLLGCYPSSHIGRQEVGGQGWGKDGALTALLSVGREEREK